jgi:uncharacterized ubiquitin-like protein YukD
MKIRFFLVSVLIDHQEQTKISYNSADSTAITFIPKASFIDGTCKKMNLTFTAGDNQVSPI